MSIRLRSSVCKTAGLFAAAGLAALLTGCGVGKLAGPSPVPGVKIHGNVHGGAFPIQGANIRLMETVTGTWSSTTGSYQGNAKQLLTTTSDAKGSFLFPDTWTCDGGQYVYLQVDGGHTAANGTNSNVIQLGVVGSCTDKLGSTGAIDKVNVFVSELSTVAAAYALNGFINVSANSGVTYGNISSSDDNNTTPGCSGTGNAMTCTNAGLAHGFQNALNLVDSVRFDNSNPTGRARTSVPGNAQSVVPEAEINTLGNILQSCVDSAGGTVGTYSSYVKGTSFCGDLFYYATPPGSTTAPTNTLQAILNIVDYPNNNVDSLFNLQPRAVFFTPTLSSDVITGNSSQKMSFTLSIFYAGTGLPNDAGMPYPVELALDGSDNVFVAYSGGASGNTYGAVNKFAYDTTSFAGAKQTTIPNPSSIALDTLSNVWLSNDSATNGNVFQINTASSGTLGGISNTLTVPGGYASGVAVDLKNGIWTSRDASSGQALYRFAAGATTADTFTGTTLNIGAPSKRLFVDALQNVLGVTSATDNLGVSNSTANAQVWLFNYYNKGNAGTMSSGTLAASNGYGLAMSNSDYNYLPLNGQLDTEYLNSSSVVTPNFEGSYTAASGTGVSYTTPLGVAMDGAGSLFWSDFTQTGMIFKFVMKNSPSVTNGTLTSFLPCYPVNGACDNPSVAYLRAMAVDSSGAMWYLSKTGKLIQTLGMAAPTFPLLSYAHNAKIP